MRENSQSSQDTSQTNLSSEKGKRVLSFDELKKIISLFENLRIPMKRSCVTIQVCFRF